MTDVIDDILGVQASPQRTARDQAPPIPLDGDRRHARTPRRRVFHNALRTKAAIEALNGLPADGETWHVVMAGSYDSFDLVDAMLAHAAPATITDLHLATLGFNAANARRLLELHDTGQVRRCTMIVSMYYEADHKEKEVCYQLARELPARGQPGHPGGWYLATRSHAKIIAAAFTDGRHFVIESSANLRTCRNLEQFTITHDRGLFEFHRSWMHEVKAHEDARTPGNTPGSATESENASRA